MGLLSDPKRRQKILDLISSYNNKLCFICYVAGLVWFLALAYTPLNAGTYFSENALLPGLVKGHFYSASTAEKYYEELKVEIKKDRRSMPLDWIQQQFEDLGLDTFIQNYTFTYPYKIIGEQNVVGANVYGILRAPRSASTEALVLSVPFRPPVVDTLTKTHGGLAMMLACAKHFRKFTFWSKDIIFLVTQHEQIGMQAWLDAYHSSSLSPYIVGDDLHGRSGSIQAAINLEIPSNKITGISYRLQGLNGQLPNLDLVNLVTRLCRMEQVDVRIHGQSDYYDPESFDGYLHSLKTMATMMWYQAPGVQQGNHGLFHRYHIEALTLVGFRKKSSYNKDFQAMGTILEGVFRSLNNLLERFHQSFFFYVLPATNRYVSIGLYMPPFGLLAVGLLIKALALWIKSNMTENTASESNMEKEPVETVGGREETTADTMETTDGSKDDTSGKQKSTKSSGLLSLVPVLIVCWVFSVSVYSSVGSFIEAAQNLRMSAADGLLYGFFALFISAAALLASKISKFDIDLTSLKCVALIFEGLVLASVALMNISLATIMAVVWVPISVIMTPTNARFFKLLQSFLLILISPLSMLFLGAVFHEYAFNGTTDNTILEKSWTLSKNSLLSIVLDGMMLGNWAFGLSCVAFYPTWLMLWSLVHGKQSEKVKTD